MGVDIEEHKTVTFKCDRCGETEGRSGKNEYQSSVSERIPKHWAEIKLERDAYDWKGNPVADGSRKFLMCKDCVTSFVDFLNEARNDE